MTDFTSIDMQIDNNVAVIRLNRPEAGNALSLDLVRELAEAALTCDQSPEVRAVLVAGNGPRFCVGGDIKAFAAQGDGLPGYVKKLTHYWHAALSRFNRMDAPVVGAVHGAAAGGGLGLALALDLAVAGQSAKFTLAFTGIGLAMDSSSSFFLARHVGLRRAKEIALLNPVMTAAQALDWGLINQVVPDDAVFDTAFALASRLAKGATKAFGATKRLLLSGLTESLETQMELEALAISDLAGQPDAREGIKAFLEKRPPEFTGE